MDDCIAADAKGEMKPALRLGRDGMEHLPAVLDDALLQKLLMLFENEAQNQPGIRLAGKPELATYLGENSLIGRIAKQAIGPAARPVRAILFDKGEGNNWSLAWHQDRTIAVRSRIETAGFGPWSIKAGIQHVSPPWDVLAGMVTLRIHLDSVDTDNAPLLVLPGSHVLGPVVESAIPPIVASRPVHACLADAGDIWIYATPILHASEAARRPRQRRVLQVDYAAIDLPDGLEWLGIDAHPLDQPDRSSSLAHARAVA